jgi:hypothetical protein
MMSTAVSLGLPDLIYSAAQAYTSEDAAPEMWISRGRTRHAIGDPVTQKNSTHAWTVGLRNNPYGVQRSVVRFGANIYQ